MPLVQTPLTFALMGARPGRPVSQHIPSRLAARAVRYVSGSWHCCPSASRTCNRDCTVCRRPLLHLGKWGRVHFVRFPFEFSTRITIPTPQHRWPSSLSYDPCALGRSHRSYGALPVLTGGNCYRIQYLAHTPGKLIIYVVGRWPGGSRHRLPPVRNLT